MMKKTLFAAALAIVAISGSAMAQSAADPLNETAKGAFVGGQLGTNLDSSSRFSTGLNAGYQFNSYLRAEGTYDYMWRSTGDASALMANIVPQYHIPGTTITPYVLAGAGMGFGQLSTLSGAGAALYDVGTGVRLGLSKKVDLDLRYRYLGHFNAPASNPDLSLMTMGISYKF